MRIREKETIRFKTTRGSLTVEAAVIIPLVLLCIFWMVEAGIALYSETLELVQKQEMWLGFHPAAKFRKLELLGDIVDTLL